MMRVNNFLSLLLILLLLICVVDMKAQNNQPFNDPDLPLNQRIYDLISRMSLDQKISQLHFDASAIPSLGVKKWNYWSEALHGVARHDEATVFPQVIGLGSTWNPEIIEEMGVAIGKEARVFNNLSGKGLTYFSPTINVARDPRWGRTEEAYSEDPYLTGKLGNAFVNGLQSKEGSDYMLAAATVKHFVADNSEFHRSVSSSFVDMRDLREYYFPAFETAVTDANTASVMATYRGLNGIPNCANSWLLDKVLRDEWGFNGYVVSDCWAVSDIVNRQSYVSEDEKAVQISVLAGTDLNCGDYYQKYLKSTYEKGYISEEDIDQALFRVLESRFLLGDFDPDHLVPWKSLSKEVLNSQEHQDLATDIARESIVLLKNEDNNLPIKADQYKSIAVIGAKAKDPEYGGYTGYPNQAVSILQGIQYKVGAAQNAFEVMKAERFHKGSYITKIIDFSTFEKQNSDIIGHIHPLRIKNGDWFMFKDLDLGSGAKGIVLSAASNGTGGEVKVRVDDPKGKVIATIDVENTGDWNELQDFQESINHMEGIHDIYMEFSGSGDHLFNLATFKFVPKRKNYQLTRTNTEVTYVKGCDVNSTDKSGFKNAIKAASESEVVVFVYGTDLTVANEGKDPANIEVPEIQRELLQKVYEKNPNIILVMAVGFPLTINWENENISSIVGAWFGGQNQGIAVADVLFGDYNPGGKLPMTWYKSEGQLPDFTDYNIRKADRTYQYFKGNVIYPFGYGLSYTDYKYSDLKLDKEKYSEDEDIYVSIDVTNIGEMDGDEVVQLYVRDEVASLKTPLKKLIDFERVHLKKGETKTVKFIVNPKQMGFWDIKRNDFIVESGIFQLMAGTSSDDLSCKKTIEIEGKDYEQGIIRINAGGDYYVDKSGDEWMPDYGFDFGGYSTTQDDIADCEDPKIFQTTRERADTADVNKIEYPNADYLYKWQLDKSENTGLYYSFEVLNGKYDINLYFTELEHNENDQRVFSIEIENKRVINNLDIYNKAGYKKAHKILLEDIIVSDGYLDVEFIESIGLPCISGIEVIPVETVNCN